MTDLHDLFKQSVPEAPSPQGWVQGARSKRRRRQVAAGGVAALAVVAVAVPLVLNLPGQDETIVAAPPSPSPTTPGETPPPGDVALDPAPEGRVGAAACWNDGGEPVTDTHNAGTIPTGAVRAWLCTNPQHYGTAGPLEPLVTDLDGLVEAFYAQPEVSSEDAQALAEWYTVVFEYSDGRTQSFSGDIQDSTAMTDGDVRLQGSEAFYEREVEARWLEQRERLRRPAAGYAAPQECPAVSYQQSLLPVSLEEVVGGYACATEAGEQAKVVELRESLAAQIGAEALADGVPVSPSEEGGDDVLVLTDAWGGQIQLRKAGERYEFRGETSLVGWTPSPEFAAELEALFTE